MVETWYELEDGSAVDPNDCVLGADGRPRHSSGATIAMRDDLDEPVPKTRSVDPDEERGKHKAKAEAEKAKHKVKEMEPEKPGTTYKTRDMKAE